MIRTGARSIWIEMSRIGAPQFPSLSPSSHNGHFDVAIVGAGITGLSTASSLINAGIKKIAVIEAMQIGKGVTGYSTAKITSQHNLIYDDLINRFGEQNARFYAEMNQAGLKHILDNIQNNNIDCDLSRQPAYTFTQRNEFVEPIQKEVEAARKCGIPASFVSSSTQISMPFDIMGAVRFEDQAQFNSYDYCIGLSKALASKGVTFFENSRISEIDHLRAPHTLKTSEGASLEADYVVLATHLPFLDRSGHFAFVEPVCSYVVAFKAKDPTKRFPDGMYITAEEPKKSIRSAYDGSILIVGGFGHPMGDPPGNDTENAIHEIEKWTIENFGPQEKICHWMAHDYRPPDHLPYIGYLHRGCSTIFCATGFMKWGITLGAASGVLISDLIASKGEGKTPTSQWLEVVDSRRWDLTQSAAQVVKAQVHVGKHFVGDKIKARIQPIDIEDLASGRGGICKTKKGDHVAAYRDEGGNLFTVSPVCTHLGCNVTWNQSDKTWDCPCHGSRYNFDGAVIHGPTVSPLKKVDQQS